MDTLPAVYLGFAFLALTVLSLLFADWAFAKGWRIALTLAALSVAIYFAGSHSQIEIGLGFSRGVLLLALVVLTSAVICTLVARLVERVLHSPKRKR